MGKILFRNIPIKPKIIITAKTLRQAWKEGYKAGRRKQAIGRSYERHHLAMKYKGFHHPRKGRPCGYCEDEKLG